MKRNLLIGTSLVAAFSTVSAKAPSNEEMRISGAVSDAYVIATKALAPEFDTKVVALKAETGSTLFAATLGSEAGRKVLADVLKSKETDEKTLATKFADLKDKKTAVAEIAKALATNVELRKLVAEYRPQVVAAIKAESEAKKTIVTQEKKVDQDNKVDQDKEKVQTAPVAEEATVVKLLQSVTDTTTALTDAINAEDAAKTAVTKAVADVTTAKTTKEAADKALTDAQTATKEAADKAAAAKTAAESAVKALEALNADHKAKEQAITAAQDAMTKKTAAGTAATAAETDALNVLTAELATIAAKIAAATTTQTDTAAELDKADALAEKTAKTVEAKTKAQADATSKLEAAEKAKTDADAELTAKTTAVTDATSKLEAAKAAAKAAAEKAATETAEKAKAATEAAKAADLNKTELETAAEAAKAKVVELGKKQTSLQRELSAARAIDTENSTEATKAAVKAKEDATVAIAKELAEARITENHAKQAAAKAELDAAKAESDAKKASEAKDAADADLTAAKAAAKAADEAVKTAKATIAQAAAKAAADAQAAKAAADATAAQAAAAQTASERAVADKKLADLKAQLAAALLANPADPAVVALQAQIATAEQAAKDAAAKDDAAKKALENAQLAEKNATAAAAKSQADLLKAQQDATQAAADAKTLNEKLAAEQKARKEAEKARKEAEEKAARLAAANSDFAIQVSALTAKVDAADADKALANIIASTEAKLKAAKANLATAEEELCALVDAFKALKEDEDADFKLTSLDDIRTVGDELLEKFKQNSAKFVKKIGGDFLSKGNKHLAAMPENTPKEKTAKEEAVAFYKLLKSILEKAPKVPVAIDALRDARIQLNLEELTAETVLIEAGKLQALMAMKVAGVEGKTSARIADYINEQIAAVKAEFLTVLKVRNTSGVIRVFIDRFEGLENQYVKDFNSLKDLFDFDVNSEAAKAAASENSALADRNALIAELQELFTPANLDAVKEASDLVAVMTQVLNGRFRHSPVEDFVTDAVEQLSKLSHVLNDVSSRKENLIRKISAANASLSGESSSTVTTYFRARSSADETKVQNLTTKTMADLKAAVAEYNAFLEKTLLTTDIDLISENEDLMNRFFGKHPEGRSDYIEGSAAEGLDAFRERTKLNLFYVHDDYEAYEAFVAKSEEQMGQKLEAARVELDTALKAQEKLHTEVAPRERRLEGLNADIKLLMTKMTAEGYEPTAEEKAEEERLNAEIKPINEWFAVNADAIQKYKATAATLPALRNKFEALEAENSKKIEVLHADRENLHNLMTAINQAREEFNADVVAVKNRELTAKIAEAVEVILSPAPEVEESEHAEEDEEGSEGEDGSGSDAEEGEEVEEGEESDDSKPASRIASASATPRQEALGGGRGRGADASRGRGRGAGLFSEGDDAYVPAEALDILRDAYEAHTSRGRGGFSTGGTFAPTAGGSEGRAPSSLTGTTGARLGLSGTTTHASQPSIDDAAGLRLVSSDARRFPAPAATTGAEASRRLEPTFGMRAVPAAVNEVHAVLSTVTTGGDDSRRSPAPAPKAKVAGSSAPQATVGASDSSPEREEALRLEREAKARRLAATEVDLDA